MSAPKKEALEPLYIPLRSECDAAGAEAKQQLLDAGLNPSRWNMDMTCSHSEHREDTQAPQPSPGSEPLKAFGQWRAAVDAAAVLRDAMKGRHVRFVGMFGNAASQPTGRIKDVTAAGFKILWDGSATAEWIDPESVVFIP